jgi:hypothetical protein
MDLNRKRINLTRALLNVILSGVKGITIIKYQEANNGLA